MALVYRVEHAVLGGGPYRPYGQDHDRGEEFWPEGADEELRRFSDDLCDAHGWYEGDADGVLRPTGSRDGLRVTAGRIYGCPSVATLRRWFNRYGSALEENGFVVTLYAVPEAHISRGLSKMQVAFDPKYAAVVRTMSPTQYIS